MRKTFKYKAKINRVTETNALRWLDLCRNLYNCALEQRINLYRQHKKSLSMYDQQNQLPKLKKEILEYKEIDAQCIRNVIIRVDKAYKAFFRRIKKGEKAGFPRFQGKYRYNSFTLEQNSWKLDGKYLTIKKLGVFKLFLSRSIEGDIKEIIIKHAPTNKWFVTFSCDNVPEIKYPESKESIGIDVGIKSFLTDSKGNVVNNPHFFVKAQIDLRKKQRKLSRRKKGSNRRNDSRLIVAKAHEKIVNQRLDFLHKTANKYLEQYAVISIEKLQIKNMVQNSKLSKSISDVGWGTFFNILKYKAEYAGRKIIEVNPHNTSQICSGCGTKVPKTLTDRIHCCPECGLIIDRDFNSAININVLGQSIQTIT